MQSRPFQTSLEAKAQNPKADIPSPPSGALKHQVQGRTLVPALRKLMDPTRLGEMEGVTESKPPGQ